MGVYQRHDSPYWWMHVETAPTGQQKVSTRIRIGYTATERKRSLEEAKAVHYAAELHAGLVVNGRPVRVDEVRFKAWAATYAAQEIPQHRGAYRERQILPRLVAAFGALALSAPADVWTEAVKAWRLDRLHTPTTVKHYGGTGGRPHTFAKPQARTVNREVGFLKQILAAAVTDKQIAVSPLAGLEALKGDAIVRRLTTLDEEARLLAQLAVDDRAIYILARDGLVRLGDCLDLRRDDDEGHAVTIRFPKNGEPLTIPVSRALRAALDAVPVDPEAPAWYFPRRRVAKDEQARTRGYIKAIARACRDATPPIPYGRKVGGVTFHWGTRMTGATRMIRNGGDGVIADVQKIGGWKTVDVLLEIYQKTVTDDMRRVVELAGAPAQPGMPQAARRPRLRRVK